jgi:hypothetical protein
MRRCRREDHQLGYAGYCRLGHRAGCRSSPHASAGAAKASVIASSTFTQQQISTLETELTNAFQQQLKAHPGHLVKDGEAAVAQVFPQGDTAKIVSYGTQHITPAVLTSSGPGSARDLWVRGVVAFATTSGGVTPPATPGPLGTTGTANVPGFPGSASPVAS